MLVASLFNKYIWICNISVVTNIIKSVTPLKEEDK